MNTDLVSRLTITSLVQWDNKTESFARKGDRRGQCLSLPVLVVCTTSRPS